MLSFLTKLFNEFTDTPTTKKPCNKYIASTSTNKQLFNDIIDLYFCKLYGSADNGSYSLGCSSGSINDLAIKTYKTYGRDYHPSDFILLFDKDYSLGSYNLETGWTSYSSSFTGGEYTFHLEFKIQKPLYQLLRKDKTIVYVQSTNRLIYYNYINFEYVVDNITENAIMEAVKNYLEKKGFIEPKVEVRDKAIVVTSKFIPYDEYEFTVDKFMLALHDKKLLKHIGHLCTEKYSPPPQGHFFDY